MIKKLQSISYLLSFLLLILSIAGCNVDQAALTKAAGVAGLLDLGSLTIASGNNQSTLQNTLATQSLEVLALDSEGNAKSGLSIKFQIVTANGGSLDDQGTSKTVSSGVDGKASVTYRSASSLGEVIILATSSAGNVSFTQIVTDSSSSSSGASGSTLLIVKGNNQTVEENAVASEDLEVLALNSLGAPLQNTDITFAIYTTLGGTLSSSALTSKVVTTSSTGKASVSFNALARMGATTVIATSSAGSAAFSVNVVAAGSTGLSSSGSTLLIVKGNNQTLEQNTSAADDFEVIALNSSGAPMSGVSVAFQVYTASAGTLTGAVTSKNVTTGSDGKASVAFSALSRLGAATVVATSSAGSAAFSINVVATGSATTTPLGSTLLMLKGNNLVIEQNTTTSLEVLALNSAGVPMADTDITFEVLTSGTISNPQPTAGTDTGTGLTAKTGSNGRASVTYTAPSSLGTATIIARSGAGSVAFNLSVGITGIGSILSISRGNGQVIVPNTLASQDLEVIATSASGSPLAGITVTFTVTTTNGGVLSNSQGILVGTTDANGKASTTFTSSNTSGPISVLASSSVGSVTFALNTSTSGSGGSSGTISFNPATYSPASGSWLNTNVGAAPSKSVTVTNTASYGLYINSIFTTTSTPFTIVSDTCPRSPTPLATTESCTVVISFSPTSSSTFSKFLFLNWSALNDGSNGQNAVLGLEGSGPPALTFVGISNVDSVTTTSLRVNWAAATGGTISQYRVYRLIAGVPSLIATLSSSTLTYSISGLVPSSTYTYRVRAVNTANEEDGNANDVSTNTDASPVPILSDYGNFVYPSNPLLANGTAFTKDFDRTNSPVGDSGMTYSCKFSRAITGALVGKSNCTQTALTGSFSLNSATGLFSWTPKLGLQGVFEFVIIGSDSFGPGYRYFTVDVAHPYASPNLTTILADFRASFGNLIQPNSSGANIWNDVSGLNNKGTVTAGTPLWTGSIDNTNTDPQRVTFDGTTEIDFGAPFAGYNKFMMDYWISNPENTFTNGSVVMKMDTSSTDNGFKITQNTTGEGKRALRFDFERSYARAILADDPSAYWRMDATSGTSFNDSIGANHIIYGDATYGSTTNTGLSLSQVGATLGEKTSTAVSVHTNRLNLPNSSTLKPTGDFTVEMWVRYPTKTVPADHTLYTFNSTGTAQGLSLYMVGGVLTAKFKPSAASTVTLTPTYPGYGHLYDQNWHYIVFTSTNSYKALFVDAKVLSYSNTNNGAITWPATPDTASVAAGGDASNPVMVDEVALYQFALSSNQVKNHLAAGDHFIKNQALFPANSIAQTSPTAYWRMGETNQGNYQDYSGNQINLFDNDWASYSTTGVYMRAGGSGLDTDGATYQHEANYDLKTYNTAGLAFNDKFTFSNWVNWINYPNTDRYHILFSFNLNSTNYYGLYTYIDNSGYLTAIFNYFPWSPGSSPYGVIKSSNPIFPSGNSTQFPLGWYHVAMTFDGTMANASDRVQFYVNGTPVKMGTPSGTIPTSLSALTGTAYEFELGTLQVNNGSHLPKPQNGYTAHDEDAVWGRVLAVNEIRAQANEGSLRYCDIPVTSRTLDPVNGKPFDYVNMMFDGTTLTLKRNSKFECALRASVNLTNEALPIVVGASANGFKGHLSDLRIHGAEVGSVASVGDAQKAFMKSSDQHRIVPVGNIVTDNMVRHYEASAAFDGVRPYGAGCEASKILWADIGHQGSDLKKQEAAFLQNFTGCSTGNGWNGDGSSTNPYRLTFDGSDDWVDLGTNVMFPYAANKFSVCLWMKTTQNTSFQMINRRGNYNWGDIDFVWNASAEFYYMISYGNTGTYATATLNNGHNLIRNGNWHYACGVYDGAKIYMYLDGTSIATPVNYTGNIYNNASMNARMTMGAGYDHFYNWPGQGRFKGDIGAVHLYNSGLTVDQVKQNCSAQAANYDVSTCAP